MKPAHSAVLAGCLAAGLVLAAPASRSAHAQAAASPQEQALAEGKRLFRADCAGCHKWHGSGGGGYGGLALSLRSTRLSREQIIETVGCGRPGTGMPYHLRDAYESDKCYGLTKEQLGKIMPMAAAAFLRPADIATIADYVLARVKGKGEPNYAECIDFFGEGSRVCNIYKSGEASEAGGGAGESR